MLEKFQTNDYYFESLAILNDNLLFIDFNNHNLDYTEISVPPDLSYKYQGNFIGLLRELKIKNNLFLYTMYLNNINNPTNFNGDIYTLKIPKKPPIPIG